MADTIKAHNSGIYEIVNSENGNRYIGSAVNLRTRWIDHRKTLRRFRHRNGHLQAAWLKYGESCFRFHTLLICDKQDLLFFEQLVMDAMRPEYNICKVAGSGLGRTMSPESRAKMSARAKGRKVSAEHIEKLRMINLGCKRPPRTDEQKQRYRLGSLGNRNSVGAKRSDEVKNRLSITSTGNKNALGCIRSAETRAKISASRIGKGKPQSLTHRENRAVALGGFTVQQVKEIRALYESGVRNKSHIARIYGADPSSINRLIAGKTYTLAE